MRLIRQLEAEHKKYWGNQSPIPEKMVNGKDCDPTLLAGWTDHDISLWEISDEVGKPELFQILFAICHNKKDWNKVSYIEFPDEIITLAGLELTQCNGNTGIPDIDLSKTHFELKGITGKELCTLIYEISQCNFQINVFTKNQYDDIVVKLFSTIKRKPIIEGSSELKPNMINLTSGTENQTELYESQAQNIVGEEPQQEEIISGSSTSD
jgi:hypothetical protein